MRVEDYNNDKIVCERSEFTALFADWKSAWSEFGRQSRVGKWLRTTWRHAAARHLRTVRNLAIGGQRERRDASDRGWGWREELRAHKVVGGELAVLAGEAGHADAGEVVAVVEGARGNAGAAGEAGRVHAGVGQEAVGVDVGVAALGAEDVAQLAVVGRGRADPVVVVVVVVAHVVAVVVVVVVLAPAVAEAAADHAARAAADAQLTLCPRARHDDDGAD